MTRYKVNGELVMLPTRTPEEQKAYRKMYTSQWKKDNPELNRAANKRYRDFKKKMDTVSEGVE